MVGMRIYHRRCSKRPFYPSFKDYEKCNQSKTASSSIWPSRIYSDDTVRFVDCEMEVEVNQVNLEYRARLCAMHKLRP